ncbi:Uncharacterised protein [Mycobacterium tuberculosis]|nr:Uncharacterised protein [Mycobacterium tuberculosis]
MVPGTAQQLMILLFLVLPGVFYQGVRERFRATLPAERDPQNRLTRAIAVGGLLVGVYAVVGGPWLADLLLGDGKGPVAGVSRHPRQAGWAILVLIVLIPSVVAWAEARLTARRLRSRYDPTPTAWDALFRDRGACFVRIRLKSGAWVGGWLGPDSAVSAYPNEADIYLQSQYRMKPDGSFGDKVNGTCGVYVRASDIEVVELVHAPQQP